MKKAVFTATLMILVVLGMGCDNNPVDQDSDIPVALDRKAARDAYLAAKENSTGPETYDEILADIALKVPGYGGHFVDANGVLNVHLLSNEELETIKATLAQYREAGVVAGITEDRLANLLRRQGRYDFLQLYNWRVALRSNVLGMEGVTSLDINEVRNSITLGVKDLTLGEEILEKVRQLRIPEAAVDIVERGPIEYDLREKRTTLAGGLQIQYITGYNVWSCTLGPVAQRNGVKGFIVNSHCTETRFVVDNEKFYQAEPSDRHIATETVDPSYFTGGSCPTGKVCAYADAAFAKWENRGTWNLGRIYETDYSGHLQGSTHRKSTRFTIISDGVWPYPGQLVQKVGRSKGWTYGEVTETCSDRNIGGTNITMLCQIVADYGADDGDSGAPVFELLGGDDVRLMGIHWGTIYGTGESVFSYTSMISGHLGGNIIYH